MKKSFKKLLIGCLSVAATAVSIVGASFAIGMTAKAASIPLVIDYFDVYKTDLQSRGVTANGNKGIIVTAEENGAYTKLVNSFVEDFNGVVELMSLDEYVFTTEFENINGEKFALKIFRENNLYYARVEIANKSAGLYYVGTNAEAGLTNLYNNSGEFTLLGGRTSFAITFDNQGGDVSINGKKVWNVYQSILDGRQMNAVDKFNNYLVKYAVEEISQPVQMCIVSVNGQKFEGVDFKDTQPAQMDVQPSYHALVGTEYTLPQATAIDFGDGDLTNQIEISVKDPDMSAVQLTDEASFIPSKAGKYTLTYSVVDLRGNVTARTCEITAKETQITEYELSQDFTDTTVGVNASIVVPTARLYSDLSLSYGGKYAALTVYKDEEALAEYTALSMMEQQVISLSEAGEYSFVFFDADNAGVDTKTVRVTAEEEMVAFTYLAEDNYYVGDRVSVPAVKAYANGQAYDMQAVIRTPDGALYSNAAITLQECGNYAFIYTADIDGVTYTKEYEFAVYDATEDLFSAEFATVTYGPSKYHNGLVGLNVESSANGVLTWNKLIDVSELTKDTLLFDILVTPTEAQELEFSTLLVTLTDASDPENYVVFRARDAYTNSYQKTFMQGRADNQQFAGYSYTDKALQTADMSGTVIEHSFNGYNAAWYYPVYNNTIKVCYDSAEKAMYVPNQAGGDFVVTADFDDPSFFTNLWGGFKSDKVKMSISVEGVITKAHYLIKSVLGYNFADEYQKDENAPEIMVDVPEGLPTAKVGTEYMLFDWATKDESSVVEESVKVYLDATGKREIPVTDGKFIPILEGNYTIEYSARDALGNVAYQTFVITAKNSVAPIEISLNDDGDMVGSVGKEVQLKSYKLSNSGLGETVTVSVLLDGDACDLKDGKFTPMSQGTYEVVYDVVDYIGQKSQATYQVAVGEYDNVPVLNGEIPFPRYILAGYVCELPAATATWYHDNEQKLIMAQVSAFLNEQPITITNGKMVVTSEADGEVKIVYTFAEGNGLTVERMVPLKVVRDGSLVHMNRFFHTEGFAEPVANVSSVKYTATSVTNSMQFIKPLAANTFSIKFGVESTGNVGGVKVKLTDVKNPNIAIVLDIDSNSDVSINGSTRRTKMQGAFNGNAFTLNYNNTSYVVSDGQLNDLGLVMTTLNGEAFNGFTSGTVYLDIELYSKDETKPLDGTIAVQEINLQVFNSTNRDRTVPMVVFNNEMGGKASVGETITVKPALVYDVLSDVQTFLVTVKNTTTNTIVKDVNGNELKDVDAYGEYAFVIDSAASFVISYTATDTSNRSTTEEFFVNVPDRIAPTISLNGAVPTTATLGSKVALPTATATDDRGEIIKLYTVVTMPNGLSIVVDGAFDALYKGTYYVRYVALDDSYNLASVELTIKV